MTDAQTEARAIVAGFVKRLTYFSRTDRDIVVKAIERALAAKDAELVEVRNDLDKLRAAFDRRGEVLVEISAQLAEAKKALDAANADLFQFLRRLGAQWFLAQNWFPTSLTDEQITEAREARRVYAGGEDER